MRHWLAVLACLLLVLPARAAELVPLPTLAARVTDLTGTLSVEQQAALDASLAALEREKGAQVAILLLSTTRPETIEEFGIRLAEGWKVGRRGVNDGVIVIVAKDDRKMRLEVGYGLEGAIPDAIAKRVVAETMAPRFRQGDFAGGLEAAVTALGGLIRGEALPAPREAPAAGVQGEATDSAIVMLFLVVALAAMARALLGMAGSLAAAAVAGWLAWTVFATWIAVVIAAVAAFLFSFAKGGGGGGLGTSGGSSWSSSDSGGGFSGGGGDFGGGGASGDW